MNFFSKKNKDVVKVLLRGTVAFCSKNREVYAHYFFTGNLFAIVAIFIYLNKLRKHDNLV